MTLGYSPANLFRNEGNILKTIAAIPGKLFSSVMITGKTWMNLSHVETYVGNGKSVAARFSGVDIYPLREDECLCVLLEPSGPFDLDKAMRWFYSHAQGMKYDLWGMRIFYRCISKTSPNRMWCSEFVTEFYHAGGFEPFNPLLAADRVAPAQFLQTNSFRLVWYNHLAFKTKWIGSAKKSIQNIS